METASVQLPMAQSLTEAYIKRSDPQVESIFGSHPAEESDWKRRFQWLREQSIHRVAPEKLAHMLMGYNKQFNASDGAEAGIKAIAAGAPVIVGGQQAGLWTGPLLVIHKAVSIIRAAREASRMLEVPVVPVFWVAGEDHDWEEASHALILTREDGIERIALERPGGARRSVSQTRLTQEAMAAAVEQLSAALEDSAYKRELIERLTLYAGQSASLSDWFAHMMGWLFGDQGLVLMDADHPELRRLEAPMFKALIERNDELEDAYRRGAEAVEDLGYPLQAEVAPGGANLFIYRREQDGPERNIEGERTLLFKRDGCFENRRGTLSWTKDEMLAIAAEAPERLSNNVLTRPLMQDYVLPVLGTVLGPGEIAYWALTAEAFRTLDMQMPIVVPRMSFTLVEGAIAKHMMKYGLTFEDVAFRFQARRADWLKKQDEFHIERHFAEVKKQFADLYEPLLEMVSSVQAGLSNLGESNKGRIIDQISFLEAHTKEAHAIRFTAGLKQLDRIALSLWPEGKPQERTINAAVYLSRYGRAWLQRLLEAPFEISGGHLLIYL
ncbi:bacillithiol biosynthesis cysteine-adding enzyme BshC [Paenibacillus oenotherae]|uniref:Putative cysteine ligase BshC n=1 Tax=Paenibacillus oenotherae TaxID=1435645 RepID=A0ABS7D192_9BACL|nr:bacillithiol biosynthesis cysteine-adding enzyme BshC [Paenibacillus oenotherae]MBW7473662.1 bacillithiol biosynthesis cysteine-adding enzyme BshC [Paenibacillus oenotherae]